jgi:hypothetical protein
MVQDMDDYRQSFLSGRFYTHKSDEFIKWSRGNPFPSQREEKKMLMI